MQEQAARLADEIAKHQAYFYRLRRTANVVQVGSTGYFAAFCIDLTENIDQSSGSNYPDTYQVVNLADAPSDSSGGPQKLGLTGNDLKIKQLWAHYIDPIETMGGTSLPAMTSSNAALFEGFQLAIWKLIYGSALTSAYCRRHRGRDVGRDDRRKHDVDMVIYGYHE